MDLSKILRKRPTEVFQQVDTFWFPEEKEEYEYSEENECDNTLLIGQNISVEADQVSLNYFCIECDDLRTFSSNKEEGLRGVIVSNQVISIDCILQCNCGAIVHTWFLVEAEEDIRYQSPKVRILHFREKLTDKVNIQFEQFGEFSEWLEKAKRANRDGLGSGGVIYLRKVYESIIYNIAIANNIPITDNKGTRLGFRGILKKVILMHPIIPSDFSENGYDLFGQLSEIIHGDGSEEEAFKYFDELYTLVTSIIIEMNQKEELRKALKKFHWSKDHIVTN